MKKSFVLNGLIQRFKAHGSEFYAVGGYVRDLIFDTNHTTDIDIITTASETEIENLLLRDFYVVKILNVFKVKDPLNNTTIEIISVEKEKINQNLKDRDFTINSIVYDLKTNAFLYIPKDFTPNILQLNNLNYINTNANAALRAIRISLEYNMILSRELETALYKTNIQELNKNKAFEEFCKIICLPNGLATLAKFGLLQQLIPDYAKTYTFNQNNSYHDLNLFAHINKALEQSEPILELRMALVLHDLGKLYTAVPNKSNPNFTSFYKHELKSTEIAIMWLNMFQAPNTFKQVVKNIILNHMNKTMSLKKLVGSVGLPTAKLVLKCHLADIQGRINVAQQEIDFISDRLLQLNDFKEIEIKPMYNSDKPELVIMIGLPRSGKSTFVEQNYDDYNYLSRDEIRTNIFGYKGNMLHEAEVSTIFNKRYTEFLNQNKNIVIDNTNIQKKYRKQFINQAKAHKYKIKAIYIDAAYEDVVDNANKENFPVEVIDSMFNRLDLPLREEGYYQIKKYKPKFKKTGVEFELII